MLNRLIGLVAMLAAAFMWVMAVATVIRMVGVWPDEVVLHLFMTALCALSGVALWSFGAVYFGRAREAKEAARRERLGLDPVVDPVVPEAGAGKARGGADGVEPEASARPTGDAEQGGEAEQAGESEQAGEAEPTGGASTRQSVASSNEGVGSVDLKDLSFDNIAPEHFALAPESSAEQESAGAQREDAGVDTPAAEHGTAQVMLRALPEVREALAETGRTRVKLVRKAMGAGKDPLLVVLLGWTPIGLVEPDLPEYQALIDFAGGEGEVSADSADVSALGDDDAIHARLDMRG